ncbi:MAG: MOSC domain-containing protein [Chloroflexi bacterium]|nr:MOSC domain-containing protein [Chloroflexota bacterium]
MAQGTIASLQIVTARHAPMESKESVRAIADLGLEGDIHAKRGSARQVLFMDEETLTTFGLNAGRVRENITTRGIAMQSLAEGTRVRAGTAVFELTKSCAPCEFINDIQPGLREKMEGQRGMLARVVEGGEIKLGDAIEVLPNR